MSVLPPLPANLVLLCEVGSTAHGTGLPSHEDRDEMGIMVETEREVLGLGAGFKTKSQRTQPDGVKSRAGDTDRVLYSLRHFLGLAASGNPSILVALFAPVISSTETGDALRALAPAFAGRHIIPRFRGYMMAQTDKLERNAGQRMDLVDQHGYDTKFAMHAARLGFQGIEFVTTGWLALPMEGPAGDWLRRVRRGEIPKGEWRSVVGSLDRRLAKLSEDQRYPSGPDREAIEAFSVAAHRRVWDVKSRDESGATPEKGRPPNEPTGHPSSGK